MGMDLCSRQHHEKGIRVGYALTQSWHISDWPVLMGVCMEAGFGIPESWYYNGGEGPETQAECDQIADLLETYLDQRDDAFQWKQGDFGEVSRSQIREFIYYLRRCGGFRIY